MRRQLLAKISPWLLTAACTLLALIIGFFAVNNFQREKRLMQEALVQQGLTIARFVMSSSRSSMRGSLRNIHVAMWKWTDHVQMAIDNVEGHPGMGFICLIDPDGTILASSDESRIGTKVDDQSFDFSQGLSEEEGAEGAYQFKLDKNNHPDFFQVGALFFPFGQSSYIPRRQGLGFSSRSPVDDLQMLRGRGNRKARLQFQELRNKKFILLIELSLDEFKKAVRLQLAQILSLCLVLLLVGIGSWLSLITLQGLKGSQSRLRQIREFTDILVSKLPVGLIATGNDGKIRIINEAAEEMVGVQSAIAIGKTPANVLPPQISNELESEIIRGQDVIQKEIGFHDAERGKMSFLTVALPVVDSEKKFAGNTLLLQDLRQIKNLQRELRRNERLAALGKMAAGVAHELRNPLSSIKGLALLLKAKLNVDMQGKETADILVGEVERLNRSIGELLDYARPQKLQLEKINISQLLNKSATLLATDVEATDVELLIDCGDEYFVNGDKDKLNQVFLNLLLNSLQAIDGGGVMKIGVFQEEDIVSCRFEDDGRGLDQESISKVFDPYFTTKSDGTGLGLAMSAKIIEEHGGSIEFRSELGKGTVVTVRLPSYSEGIS